VVTRTFRRDCRKLPSPTNLCEPPADVQLISVISLLSADVPDLNSPANVDAAKEVRENFPGKFTSS
jgi:hypothetical protein